MGDCGSCGPAGGGPFAEGVELVDFVSQAHGGTIKSQPIPDGGLTTNCRGCGKEFLLKTFVGSCPHCGGVHAVSPPQCHDEKNIQFAGKDYRL